MTPRRWDVEPCDASRVAALAEALALPPVIARLLVVRGLDEPAEAARFLAPSLDHLHDPFGLADMDRAVDRLRAAIDGREPIAVHGDYDVDGVSSTVMLRRALEMLGGQVTHYLPERLRDGYGLNPPAIDRLHAAGTRLIVSVDCGIRSDAAARRARELGIDLIVTDHHEPDGALPSALAVINPKRPDCRYPDKHLAGVGVAFKLVQALCQRADREKWLPGFVKIAALGTIADVVPLVGENRVLARLGLEGLSGRQHAVGLRALLDEAKLLGRPLDSYHVSFVLAPRINAAGRMASPDLAAQLLLIGDEDRLDEARALARQLSEENAKRQDEERTILEAARAAIDKDPAIGAHHVLVVAGEGWHRGVIGIVASKLVDSRSRPAIVLSIDGDLAHGSCRSIPAFDMLDALTRCEDLFERYGGHRQAAGLTIRADRIGEFRQRMAEWGLEVLTPEDLFPRVRVDAELPLSEIGPEIVDGLDRLAPFGMGNPSPVFRSGPARVTAGPRILKERHLSLSLSQGTRTYRAVMWRGAEWAPAVETQRERVDVAYSLERNHYMGETTIELRIAAVHQPDDRDVPSAPAPPQRPALQVNG
jgi:single-stranded-DNA-specific exonuclease